MTFSEQFSTILVKIANLFKTKADKTALSSYALKSDTYTKQETTNLTLAMANSGEILD